MKSKILLHLILLTFLASLVQPVHAQAFSVIHTFTGIGAEGGTPTAGVTIRGNALFGTTTFNCGSVYKLTRSGSSWLFSTLARIPRNNCTPVARAAFGPDGHLYGSNAQPGGPYGGGTVFKLTPQVGPCRDVACYWMVNDVHDFNPLVGDGYNLYGDLTFDQQGNIYGTTQFGGTYDWGTAYELTPSGNGYTESILYSFSGYVGVDGGYPFAGLVRDTKGDLFGTTIFGGEDTNGTVFEITYVPGVGWTEKVLHYFQDANDGESPRAGLILDSVGNLYGTTPGGGIGGGGTVFELSPSGDAWTFKVLYSFSGCGSPGTLSIDGTGNLYGTAACAGIYGYGSIFKLSNTPNGWVYTSLYDFTGFDDGRSPQGIVSIDTDGTLYGATQGGGDHGYGVVWMIKP